MSSRDQTKISFWEEIEHGKQSEAEGIYHNSVTKLFIGNIPWRTLSDKKVHFY